MERKKTGEHECGRIKLMPTMCFLDFEKCNFCVFRSFKVLVDISWKCVVKISIQHYCGTLLFEYCSNDVQSVLC